MKDIFTLAKMSTRRYMRDKTALFFTLLFPLVFLVVFGYIFNNNSPNFNVAVFNSANNEAASQFIKGLESSGVFKIKDAANEEEAKTKLSRSEIDAYIIIPESFGATDAAGKPSGQLVIRYSQGNEQGAQMLVATVDTIMQGFNQKLSPYTPPFAIKAEAQNVLQLSRFDYTLSGLIGFSLMSLGIFGVVNGFVSDKKTGAIGRMRVTPLKAWRFIIGTAMNRVLMAIISVALMLAVAAVLFDFTMRGSWPSFIAVIILGAICMFGIGLAVGGWAKSEDQAAPLANLVTFPMMFLSGVFFPIFIMPIWLQQISHYLPLTPIIEALRQILTEGKTLPDLGPELLIIVVWSLIAYIIAGKVFRWE